MAHRDYKNRPRERAVKSAAPGWLWMLAGFLLGLFVAFLMYLKGVTPEQVVAAVAGRAQSLEVSEPPAAEPQARAQRAQRPRFEFYTMLPEMEIPVPEAEVPARKREEALDSERASGTYLVQVGSFRSFQEADRLKASLILAGFEATIQTVSIDGKRTWHRVRLGPFTGVAAADRARKRVLEQLTDYALKPMVMKVNT